MSTKSNAVRKNVQVKDVKPILSVVHPVKEQNPVILELKQQAEEVTPTEVQQPQETPTNEAEQSTTVKPLEIVSIPTIEEIKNRATVINMLQEKHSKLIEKRKSLDKFVYTHEKESVSAQVTDANGVEFVSHSPKTIKILIENWKQEFSEAIEATELELRKQFNLLS